MPYLAAQRNHLRKVTEFESAVILLRAEPQVLGKASLHLAEAVSATLALSPRGLLCGRLLKMSPTVRRVKDGPLPVQCSLSLERLGHIRSVLLLRHHLRGDVRDRHHPRRRPSPVTRWRSACLSLCHGVKGKVRRRLRGIAIG